ncbi:hypothetical protein, partial [uncultured Microbacterium sp.]|uniref:hypothetical protein n=1 Tax=uncultured Microbacterium sp. TaxID=191216 RepID=UPI0028D5943C
TSQLFTAVSPKQRPWTSHLDDGSTGVALFGVRLPATSWSNRRTPPEQEQLHTYAPDKASADRLVDQVYPDSTAATHRLSRHQILFAPVEAAEIHSVLHARKVLGRELWHDCRLNLSNRTRPKKDKAPRS